MHTLASGIDDREVETGHETKSVGHEETFLNDIGDIGTAQRHLLELSMKTAERVRHKGLKARVVTLKIKYNDFTLAARSFTLDDYTDDGMIIYSTVRDLLSKTEAGKRPVRLLGVSVSGLRNNGITGQLSLFPGEKAKERTRSLNRAIDSVNDRFGKNCIVPGRLLSD
jgi:DNA polymerase-4